MKYIFKNSILNTSRIVLANYTALCGLHKTEYAVLKEKQHNIYTCVHEYTSRHSMRKFYINSMMILIKNSMMNLIKICIMIIHTGAHILLCIIWFMRKLQKNSMMNKSENSKMNICAVALVFYTAICGFQKTVYAEL